MLGATKKSVCLFLFLFIVAQACRTAQQTERTNLLSMENIKVGDQCKVIATAGVNLRDAVGGNLLGKLEENSIFKIVSPSAGQTATHNWIEINQGDLGRTGYIAAQVIASGEMYIECGNVAPTPITPGLPSGGEYREAAASGNVCGTSLREHIGSFVIDYGDTNKLDGSLRNFDLIRISSSDRALELQFVAENASSGRWSGRAPFAARLVGAIFRGKELLWKNRKGDDPLFARPTEWGRFGLSDGEFHSDKKYKHNKSDKSLRFVAFAGIEIAYPNQEHGEFANDFWNYETKCMTNGSNTAWGYVVHGPQGGLKVLTIINGHKWEQIVLNASENGMFYTNVMVPAGRSGNLHDIEVDLPSQVQQLEIHSANGAFCPNCSQENNWGAKSLISRQDATRPNNITKFNWIGWFLPPNSSKISCYGMINHNDGYGLNVSGSFYPKFFCGAAITPGVSDNELAYCEMWFSPNARTFWDGLNLPGYTGFKAVFEPYLGTHKKCS
ncbi:MAG: hypothetical protein KBD78_02415 [Oligoflexales bacterium]|nr:hypothetical protein [Oligoflexales bacterium]